MASFKITSAAGVEMGTFEGATATDALDAMARDAGYRDQAHAAEAAGAFEGKVEEVEDSTADSVDASDLCTGMTVDVDPMSDQQYHDLKRALRSRGLDLRSGEMLCEVVLHHDFEPRGDVAWITPPECQGQMVEVQFSATADDDGYVWRRVIDRSVGPGVYEIASRSADERDEPWEPQNEAPAWA